MLSYTEVQNQSGIDPPVIKENNGHYELSFLKWGGANIIVSAHRIQGHRC